MTPGLINTHTGHPLFWGMVEVQPLAPWTEQAYVAGSPVIEPRSVVGVAREAGMRAVVAEPILRQGGSPIARFPRLSRRRSG